MDEAIPSNVADLLYLKGLAMLFDTHAIEHLRNSGTRKVLRHSRHWRHSHSGNQRTPEQSGTQSATVFDTLEAFYLTDSIGRLVMLLDFNQLKHLLGTGCVYR